MFDCPPHHLKDFGSELFQGKGVGSLNCFLLMGVRGFSQSQETLALCHRDTEAKAQKEVAMVLGGVA